MKLRYAVCFAALISSSPSTAEEFNPQETFLAALSMVETGQLQEGIALLRDLYQRAPTPRVRLELARAVYLAGDLTSARKLFVEAYDENPPPDVKANIVTFITAIDRRRGKLSVSASVARYSNPLQQPGTYSLNFGGIDLTFEPDGAYRNLWGFLGSVSYQKEMSDRLSLSASANYRELPGSLADRFLSDFSIQKGFDDGKYDIQIGVIRLDQPNQSFTLPYVQGGYSHSLSAKAAIQPSLKAGYYRADMGQQLSGWQLEATVPLVVLFAPSKAATIGPVLFRRDVGFPEQSYTSIGIGAAAALRWDDFNLELNLQARSAKFDATDPFWGAVRKDKGVSGSAVISSDKLQIGPLLPAVGLTCDYNESSIRYYQQKGCDFSFELRKIF